MWFQSQVSHSMKHIISNNSTSHCLSHVTLNSPPVPAIMEHVPPPYIDHIDHINSAAKHCEPRLASFPCLDNRCKSCSDTACLTTFCFLQSACWVCQLMCGLQFPTCHKEGLEHTSVETPGTAYSRKQEVVMQAMTLKLLPQRQNLQQLLQHAHKHKVHKLSLL